MLTFCDRFEYKRKYTYLEEKVAPIKSKTFKSLRLVLFFPFRCSLAGFLQFISSTEKYAKLFHPNFRGGFSLFYEKILSRWM